MDITLQRILSLIPSKPDGKPVHGATKDFAVNIGYKDGTIVSLWKSGVSDSYNTKLYEISKKYGVSVEWLKGETDDKNPVADEENPERLKLINSIMEYAKKAPDDKLHLLNNLIDNIK